jgi:hypothetical protein
MDNTDKLVAEIAAKFMAIDLAKESNPDLERVAEYAVDCAVALVKAVKRANLEWV